MIRPIAPLPLALLLSLSSCVVPDPGADPGSDPGAGPDLRPASPAERTVGQAFVGDGGKCPSNICGMNSAVLDDGFFHELNLDGLMNDEGYSISYVRKNGAYYQLAVVNGKISATALTAGPPPAPLTGTALTGLELRLKKVSSTGVISYRTLAIEQVARADYWAKLTSGAPTHPIETYKFRVRLDNGFSGYLCQNGAEFVDPTSPVRAMSEHHALVFEGERIRVETLSISPSLDPRWFNFGCAETALAKLQLNGHTRASQAAGFFTTLLERQTFLKMITADYCGHGNSFTVSGQPLRWTDDRGTMTIAPTVTKVVEARWDSQGAVCLNTPRVDAHPSDASRAVFERGAAFEIAHTCSIPACAPIAPIYHLTSWNPTPFTN
jgi:hypothetical protein